MVDSIKPVGVTQVSQPLTPLSGEQKARKITGHRITPVTATKNTQSVQTFEKVAVPILSTQQPAPTIEGFIPAEPPPEEVLSEAAAIRQISGFIRAEAEEVMDDINPLTSLALKIKQELESNQVKESKLGEKKLPPNPQKPNEIPDQAIPAEKTAEKPAALSTQTIPAPKPTTSSGEIQETQQKTKDNESIETSFDT